MGGLLSMEHVRTLTSDSAMRSIIYGYGLLSRMRSRNS